MILKGGLYITAFLKADHLAFTPFRLDSEVDPNKQKSFPSAREYD